MQEKRESVGNKEECEGKTQAEKEVHMVCEIDSK
jgi:hypothetical protein